MRLALFDLDKTLLPIDTDHAWGHFTCELGWVDAAHFKAKNDAFYEQYKAGTLDSHEHVAFAIEAVVQRGKAAATAAHREFMRRVIRPEIKPRALALLDKHRRAGDHIVLITATNEFVATPIAHALGIDEVIAVQLQRDANGWYTQKVLGCPSARVGKVVRLGQWLTARGLTWSHVSHSTFYTDSINDLALMERVDEPIATNASEPLRSLAVSRGWQVLDLFPT